MSNPAWLEAKIDQRMAELRLAVAMTDLYPRGITMIMTPLTEPAEDSKVGLDFWERSCDNCGKYTPPGDAFYTGTVQKELPDGRPVYITFGVCKNCRETFPEGRRG